MQLSATACIARMLGRVVPFGTRGIRLAAIGLALWWPLPAADPAVAEPHEAYIWQRAWTAPVARAMTEASGFVSGWRVLAAESSRPGALQSFAVDWAALDRTKRDVVAVVRIDGHISLSDEPALQMQLQKLWRQWRVHPRVRGIEIDYDCGVASLSAYADFLMRLRSSPDMPQRLSVTALPAWLAAPALDRILAAADEAVLQVHAVRSPKTGLFDAALARQWIDRLDRRDAKPFRVALPDYGTRIVEGEQGRIIAIESETPRLMGDAAATELVAEPREVAALLRDLGRTRPARLAGFVWFRLPTEADTRIWSLATLRAVIRGEPVDGQVSVVARPGEVAGMSDIVLVNDGDADIALPKWVDLPRGCRYADGVNGYTLGDSRREISLERLQTGLLHAHHERVIGWMRCAGGQGIHVRP